MRVFLARVLDFPAWQIKQGAFGLPGTQPDGQITSDFQKWFVKPRNQKYFCFRLTQISS